MRKEYYEPRQKAISLLGGKCEICEDKNRLEFHHLYYAIDSRKATAGIHKEVLQYPERFQLLCATCHRIITWIKKDMNGLNKARLILERLSNTIKEEGY